MVVVTAPACASQISGSGKALRGDGGNLLSGGWVWLVARHHHMFSDPYGIESFALGVLNRSRGVVTVGHTTLLADAEHHAEFHLSITMS